ncbi:MAG: hypothetical protein IT448_08605 [Phycisphaerales bacterium]|nr:hypothetical protein [Phycisphaerales bacterium]
MLRKRIVLGCAAVVVLGLGVTTARTALVSGSAGHTDETSPKQVAATHDQAAGAGRFADAAASGNAMLVGIRSTDGADFSHGMTSTAVDLNTLIAPAQRSGMTGSSIIVDRGLGQMNPDDPSGMMSYTRLVVAEGR